MSDELDLDAIKERCEKATPGPWAWEQYGEKENCFHVGVAMSKDETYCEGRVETEVYNEEQNIFVEEVIWHSYVGDMEGATVNYGDAAFIAHARTDLPALVAEVERLRKGPCFCAFCGQAYASGKSEADLQAIQEHVRGCRSHPLNQEILTLDSRLTKIRVERDTLRARVKELEEEYSECDADAHQMATKLTLIREALDG